MPDNPQERLRALGLELPPVATPAGNYVPAVRSGDLVLTAGQLPFERGELAYTGKVGDALSQEEAQHAARLCALNALAAAPGFNGRPQARNGASDMLGEVFGAAGLHARSAGGFAERPLDAPVEVELLVEVRG